MERVSSGFFAFFFWPIVAVFFTCEETETLLTDNLVFLCADDDDRWQKSWLIGLVLTENFFQLVMHVSMHRVQPVIKKVCRSKIQKRTTEHIQY